MHYLQSRYTHDININQCLFFLYALLLNGKEHISDPLRGRKIFYSGCLEDNYPQKVICFSLTALYEACLTRDNLSRRNIPIVNRCYVPTQYRNQQSPPTTLLSCYRYLEHTLFGFWTKLGHAKDAYIFLENW